MAEWRGERHFESWEGRGKCTEMTLVYSKNNEGTGLMGVVDSHLEEEEIRLNQYCVSRLLWALADKEGLDTTQ